MKRKLSACNFCCISARGIFTFLSHFSLQVCKNVLVSKHIITIIPEDLILPFFMCQEKERNLDRFFFSGNMSVWWCFRLTSLKYDFERNDCLWLEDSRNLSQTVGICMFILLKTKGTCEWTEKVLNSVVEKEEITVKNRQLHHCPCYRMLNPVMLWMQGWCGSVSPGSAVREVNLVIPGCWHRQKAIL